MWPGKSIYIVFHLAQPNRKYFYYDLNKRDVIQQIVEEAPSSIQVHLQKFETHGVQDTGQRIKEKVTLS